MIEGVRKWPGLNEEDVAVARRISARLKPSRAWQPLKLYATSPDPSCIQGIITHYQNKLYDVGCWLYTAGWPFGGGPWARLGISSCDGEPRHDWRDFQAIKNQLQGPEWEAIELYPAESRLLDPSNYYYLWCAPSINIGKFHGRHVRGPENTIAPQRGWAKGSEPEELRS